MLDEIRAGTAGRWSRRRFVQGVGVAGLALVAGCGRLPWQAPPAKVPLIGFLSPATRDSWPDRDEAFRQGLRELGYLEGQSIHIEWRYAEGRDDRLPDLAAELVHLPVDVIVTLAVPAIQAAQQATSTIPIVFTAAADPVGAGLVGSLARPGGNVTGLSNIATDLSAKRLEQLKEAMPGLTRVAVLGNLSNASTAQQLLETRGAAQALGLQLQVLPVLRADDLASAFEAASQEGIEAMSILGDPFTVTNAARLADWAARHRLPAIHVNREFPAGGGLMGYGPNGRAQYYRAAYYVDKILKGAKPADLPVEQPREFDFVINLKTAQALGLTIPPHVLLQATEVIQ